MKIGYKILIIVIAMLLLGGLNNYRELNELAIVSSISIDKNEDKTYTLTAQIINTKKADTGTKSGSMSSEVTVYTKVSDSIQEGLRLIINESPKKLYIAHMDAIIISEEVAKENVTECIDFFIRDNETSIAEKIFIAKGTNRAEDILKLITPIENNSAKNLVKSLEANIKYEGTVIESSLIAITEALIDENKEILITACEITGDVKYAENKSNLENSDSKAKLLLANIAYFKNSKFLGYLDSNDAKMLNLLNDEIKNTIIFFYIDNKKISFESKQIKCNLDIKFENDVIVLHIDIKNNIVITEKNPTILADTKQDIKILEEKASIYVKEQVEKFIDNMKYKYKTDLLDIRSKLYKTDIESYNKIHNEFYDKYLQSIKYNIKVSSNLETEGGILKKW